jgi:hypothetical protein
MVVILLGIFKLLAAGVAAFFGGYGLLHDFRHDGIVTREGKRALYGGIIAGLLTITGQIVETLKQGADDRQAAMKSAQQVALSNQLMTQILRGVYPIKDVTFDVSFDFDPDDPLEIEDIASYKRRLEQQVTRILKIGRFSKTEGAIRDAGTNQPVGVILRNGSPLLPRDIEAEEVPWIALNDFSFVFEFYNNVSEERDIGTRNANLSFSVTPEKREFSTFSSSTFQIDTYGARVESFWDDDGSIGSLKDLSHVIGIVWLDSHSPTSDIEAFGKGAGLLHRSSSITMITMHVGAKNCRIPSYAFKKRTGPATGWWFRFGEDTLKDCSIQ